ncbi:FHA domain protein [Planctomycetes bacterium Pan216]|uniref:FHA domain protein n=1 Tax=Kolteria novifilia TaxID=2527975 RepID=A0A518B4E0_9BACT|nr:FHA domain protein [Planctomycetes bacterium Pan216]
MPFRLVAIDSNFDIEVDQSILVVGRSGDCDVIIDSKKISRVHCCIVGFSDHLIIRDLGSTNGLRVNGIRLDESKLIEGDELRLGNASYRVTSADRNDLGRGTVPSAMPRSRECVNDAPDDSESEIAPIPMPSTEPSTSDSKSSHHIAVANGAGTGNGSGSGSSDWIHIPEDVGLAPGSEPNLLRRIEDERKRHRQS